MAKISRARLRWSSSATRFGKPISLAIPPFSAGISSLTAKRTELLARSAKQAVSIVMKPFSGNR